MYIKYTKLADKHILAFGLYAALADQSVASGEEVIRQIRSFIRETIALVPTIGFQIYESPIVRRVPDKYGRTIYFRYFPNKDTVEILGVYKGNRKKL